MADDRIIVVTGATGAQGGGLARAILADPSAGFRLRAITRNPASDQARALAAAGAELVSADLDNPASVEAAFEGAYGAYCVTNYWEHFSPERELAQAANLAEAARRVGLHHVIWSTLEDTRNRVPLDDPRMPTLQGRYKVPHLDTKGEADAYFRDRGVPTTYLRTSFYWENFIHFGLGPKTGPDGVLALTLPMGGAKLPGIAVEDIGRSAFGILKLGHSAIGETIGVAGEHLTGDEIAQQMAAALGREIRYDPVSPEVFRGFGFPGADDLGNMFQFKVEFEADFRAVRDVERTRALDPALQNFRDWLGQHAREIPIG
jgi:uncharacterized protein YbjT (DUF2867 family)